MKKLPKISRVALSWAFYDWANSAFVLVVISTIFPLLFKNYWNEGVEATVSTARLGITSSVAGLVVALAAPLLGAWADRTRTIKKLLVIITLATSGFTVLLAYAPQQSWLAAAALFAVTSTGFNLAIVFYEAMLPSVSDESNVDYISGLGYGLGYIGGAIVLFAASLMMASPAAYGFSSASAAGLFSFTLVAAWWVLFSLPLIRWVPEPRGADLGLAFSAQFVRLVSHLREHRSLLYFLLAYWCYIDGVYTIIKLAVDYGAALGFSAKDLISALLLTQLIGFPSSVIYGLIGARLGVRRSIGAGVLLYTLITLWAARMGTVQEFYLLATAVGLVQGGVQSLSRSLFARMVPPEETALYFSLFNVVGRFAAVLGPALVGVAGYMSGSSRAGLSALVLLFIIGLLLLWRSGEEA